MRCVTRACRITLCAVAVLVPLAVALAQPVTGEVEDLGCVASVIERRLISSQTRVTYLETTSQAVERFVQIALDRSFRARQRPRRLLGR